MRAAATCASRSAIRPSSCTQRLKLSTELRVADGGNKHVGVVARSRGCAHLELLSVMEYLT
jgi:hypothetical protein